MSAAHTHGSPVLLNISRSMQRMITCAGFLLVTGSALAGAQSATQVVRFRVLAQRGAEVAPVAKPIAMRSAKSGISTSGLTLSTNDANLKVTASVDRSMPSGTSLAITVGDDVGGSGADTQRLGTEATDVLTLLSSTDGTRIPIAYRVDTARDVDARQGEQRLVTYTVLAAP